MAALGVGGSEGERGAGSGEEGRGEVRDALIKQVYSDQRRSLTSLHNLGNLKRERLAGEPRINRQASLCFQRCSACTLNIRCIFSPSNPARF